MIRPEYLDEKDVIENLFQLGQRKIAVEAQITELDRVSGTATWVLSFPDFPEAKGLVPTEEAGVEEFVMPRLVGQRIRVIVKGVDREQGLAACSRREAVEKAKEKFVQTVKAGDVVDAAVRAVLPPAEGESAPSLLLDVGGGILVRVPRMEAARRRAQSLTEQYKPGQRVKAKVLSLDPLQVSVRQAYPDPFTHVRFTRGQEIACTVVRVWEYQTGQKVVLIEPDAAPGMLGIAPAPYLGTVSRGDRVVCVVASYRPEKRQLRCRIRGWA